MNKLKLLLAIALLAAGGTAVSVPIPNPANPGIFGSDWRLELAGPPLEVPVKGEEICVYAGDLTLTHGISGKDATDKSFNDPIAGQALVELVSGPCEEFPTILGEIAGSASGNDLMFQMAIFPVEEAKGVPLLILTFEGELLSQTLMRGEITNATVPPTKGDEIAFWRATRGTGVPAVTPVGVLLLLGVFGLIGGIALYRRA